MEPFGSVGILVNLVYFFYAILIFALLWVFGRMGDNINKIRKMLEEELKNRKTS